MINSPFAGGDFYRNLNRAFAVPSGHFLTWAWQRTRIRSDSSKIQRFRSITPSEVPVSAIYNAESGARLEPAHRNRQARCQPDGCAVVRFRTE